MFVFKAAVVGAGTMGGQIAQTIAAAGTPVVLKDIDEALVQAGLEEARRVTAGQVSKLVQRGKLDSEQGERQIADVLARIAPTTSYREFGDVDFVIEAVPERIDLKREVFAELDAATPGRAILASNTSSLSITELGEATLRPEKAVGFHYFYPASLMPLIEIVEGEDTSAETVTAAVAFAQGIRKQPITCMEVPGFVVNRILNSAISEVWRAQEQQGLSIRAIDEGIAASRAVPVGPYHLVNLLGLDTVLHVAEHLAESYGDERFYVPANLQRLVAEGRLGAKTGGDGVYGPDGQANVPGDAEPDVDELVELLSCKTLIEACLVLEEGVATHRDIDFGMMAGAGFDPRQGFMPPFVRADSEGLDTMLERIERLRESHGERFTPPAILRRLVAQGRLGQRTGQGFHAYPRPDRDQPGEAVELETLTADDGRDAAPGTAIAWLANGQMNSISPQVVKDLAAIWARIGQSGSERGEDDAERGQGDADRGQGDSDRPVHGPVRVLVIASANPFLYSAGADIKAFATMDESGVRELVARAHGLLRDIGSSGVVTIAAVNGLAFGGGCELAMACDIRIAARSALFGQPEIKLGLIPGFGGTQRLPRLIGAGRALELNLLGDPILAEEAYELGLVNRVVDDHELLDTALSWARRLAGQPASAVEQIKRISDAGDLAEGLAAEQAAFASVFAGEDAREGISAFLSKRAPRFQRT